MKTNQTTKRPSDQASSPIANDTTHLRLKQMKQARDKETLRNLSDLFGTAVRLLHDERATELMPDFIGELHAFLERAAYPVNVSLYSTPEMTRACLKEVALRLMESEGK